MGQDNPTDRQAAPATTESPSSPADADPAIVAIRKSADDFVAAFDRQDAAAIARQWAASGTYVDEAGQVFEGRDTIEQQYEKFFSERQGAKIEISINAIRKVSPTVAIEDGAASFKDASADATSTSHYIAVHVKQEDGSWLLDCVYDSPARVPSASSRLQHLDKLTGEWTANHAGVEAEVTCKWNPSRRYLERRFVVTKDGNVESTSMEIIGWDPLTEQITSWTYSSSGGRSVGVWTPLEDGWIVTNNGVASDGAPTFSIDAWARLLGDALGWKSTARSVDGRPVRDARHVVLKKKTNASAPAN